MKTYKFHGGIHPHDCKDLAKNIALSTAAVPDELVVPLSQHLGAPAKLLIKIGDAVKRGQLIAEAGGFISAHIHSPVSGTVKRQEQLTNQMGNQTTAIIIQNDHQDIWAEDCNRAVDEATNFTKQEIIDTVKWAGIVGMGGATFPTHVKLAPPPDKKVETLIINGVECEPYLTADYRLMLERPREVCLGVKLLKQALGAEKVFFCIEDNKPDAYEVIKLHLRELGDFATAVLLPTMYPQGAEKQLITACTNKEVPSGGLPADVGICVDNVSTAFAVYEAVYWRRPLTERITTVSGDGVRHPANFIVRLGTPAKKLLEICDYQPEKINQIIYGGPMMGPAHFDLNLPIIKGSGGILVLTSAKIYEHSACVRCGRCVEVCPCKLLPSQFSVLGENNNYLATAEFNILDCMECGSCTYICPSRRPIVQWIKVAKVELAAERARNAAKKPT